jgi:hypothetical protein
VDCLELLIGVRNKSHLYYMLLHSMFMAQRGSEDGEDEENHNAKSFDFGYGNYGVLTFY